MARVLLVLAAVILCVSVQVAQSIRYSELFPHGEDAGDTLLSEGDDVSSSTTLDNSYPVFGEDRTQLTIHVDGWVDLTADGGSTTRFLPFAADVDTSTGGYVSWRETQAEFETSVISQVTESVFPELAPVNITSAVLIFWIGVAYYDTDQDVDTANTFELALATDGERTFAIYVYVNDRIQWTTGDRDGGENGLGGDPADVGIIPDRDAPDNASYIPGSNTSDILYVHEGSNTGLRGLWYFRVDGGSVAVPDMQDCVLGCDENAECLARTIGYACVCNEDYEGEDATMGSCESTGSATVPKTTIAALLLVLLLALLSM